MTPGDADALASAIAKDLKLDSVGRHQLRQAAGQLAALTDDAEVGAHAQKLAERFRTTPALAGAVLVVSTGITTERYASSLDAVSRQKYEAGLHGIGRASDVEEG